MGAVIEAAEIAVPAGPPPRASSIALAADAAQRALGSAGRSLDGVGLLLNAGVYRDGHISEPAQASLILRALGMRSAPALAAGSGIFSFDVPNGAGGMLNAIHAADSLLRSRPGGAALVVASDVVPADGDWRGDGFEPLGGAVLLRAGDPDAGFTDFRFDSYDEHAELLESRLDWPLGDVADPSPGTPVRFSLRQHEDFGERAVACAAKSLASFLGDLGLGAADVDLTVAASFPAGFAAQLARAAGLPDERVAGATATGYTAGPVAALAEAVGDGRFGAARRVVFAAVGAGITTSLAYYRAPVSP